MEYRNLKIGERGLAKDLFGSYYDDNVYCTEQRYFDWLHCDNPLRLHSVGADDLTVFGAIESDRLIGCISYVPSEVVFDGQRYSAAFTTESLARSGSGGVYGLLARRLVGMFDYCFMMGATPFLKDLYEKHLSASYHHEMKRVLLIGDVDSLGRLLEQNPDPPSLEIERLQDGAEAARQLAAGGTWVRIETAAQLRDTYWQHLLASDVACTRRDPEWLGWRYFQHPHIRYEVIAADPSQSSGIAIVRREQIAGLDCHAIRLLEFLPTEGSSSTLAAAVARYALDSGCAFLDFFCAHDIWMSRLPAAFMRPEDHGLHNIPYLLQPPEWRARRSINLISVRNRRKRKHLPELNAGHIYVTKGDGAQDVALDKGYRSAHLRDPVT